MSYLVIQDSVLIVLEGTLAIIALAVFNYSLSIKRKTCGDMSNEK